MVGLQVNSIYNCDCFVGLTRLKKESIDMVLTSPPYDYDGDTWNFEKFRIVARQLYGVLKQGGVIVWVCGDETKDMSESGASFKTALFFMENLGMKLYDTMLFHKKNPLPQNNNRYEQSFEYMFVFSKGTPNTFNGIRVKTENSGKEYDWYRESTEDIRVSQRYTSDKRVCKQDKLHSNIFSYTIGGESVGHPAPFPLQLAIDQIKTWTNEGDIVLDPFIGSGTTAVAAHELKRKWIGFEINKKYCGIAEKRIEPIKRQLTLL